jgi:hypothetical protein
MLEQHHMQDVNLRMHQGVNGLLVPLPLANNVLLK